MEFSVLQGWYKLKMCNVICDFRRSKCSPNISIVEKLGVCANEPRWIKFFAFTCSLLLSCSSLILCPYADFYSNKNVWIREDLNKSEMFGIWWRWPRFHDMPALYSIDKHGYTVVFACHTVHAIQCRHFIVLWGLWKGDCCMFMGHFVRHTMFYKGCIVCSVY